MARRCTICTHPHRTEIDTALVDRVSYRHIAAQHSVSPSAVKRHRNEHLATILAEAGQNVPVSIGESESTQPTQGHPKAGTRDPAIVRAVERDAADRMHTITVMSELVQLFHRVHLLFDACDAWLRDPDDPGRYDIGPRAENLTVIYLDLHDCSAEGTPRRKKARLSDLLTKVTSAGGVEPVSVETKHADPRELVLKTAGQLQGQTELLMKVLERLYAASEIELFEAAVLDAIDEVAPDVRHVIEGNLRRRQPVRGPLGPPLG